MSDFFDGWGDALAGPFESFGGTFETLFTNPGKLKAADIPTLLLPVPGVGSTITYDLKHPEAAQYQGMTLGILGGGYGLLSQYGPSYFATSADRALAASYAADNSAANAAAGSYLFGNGSPAIAPQLAPGDTAALVAKDFGGGASPINAALRLNAAAGVTPTTPAAAAAAAKGSAAASVAKAAGGASLVKSTLGSFVQNVKDAGPLAATVALLKGQQGQRGPGVNGGGNPPTDARGVPVPVPVQQGSGAAPRRASAATFLMLGALAGVGVWLYRKKKRVQ